MIWYTLGRLLLMPVLVSLGEEAFDLEAHLSFDENCYVEHSDGHCTCRPMGLNLHIFLVFSRFGIPGIIHR